MCVCFREFEKEIESEIDWNRLLFGNYRDFRCWLSNDAAAGSSENSGDSGCSVSLLNHVNRKKIHGILIFVSHQHLNTQNFTFVPD